MPKSSKWDATRVARDTTEGPKCQAMEAGLSADGCGEHRRFRAELGWEETGMSSVY